jgi:hypothetical protein
MHDPPIVVVLHKKGAEWDQQIQEGQCIPTGLDLDLDAHHTVALIWLRFHGAPHGRITAATCRVHPSLLRAN